jgi:dolichol-phosphate mannosyltransferase
MCLEYSDDVMVVDGHSSDRTAEIAGDLGAVVHRDNGRGKGDAIRVGISKAAGDILVFIDADGSHDPGDIPALVRPILDGEADHVSGSRMRGGSDELHGDLAKFIRVMGSDIITLGINYRFGVRLTDSQNGFRAIRKEVARSLGLREDITTIEQEMVIKTLRKGYRITEVPTHEYARRHGESHIKVGRVWFRYVYSWIRYLFFH